MSIPNTPPIPCPNTNNYRGGGAVPVFRYVYFNQDVAKGEVQQWAASADGTTNLESNMGIAVEDPSASSPHVAGVAAVDVDVSVYPWGWLQTGGYCDYIKTDGNVTYPAAAPITGDTYLHATTSETATGQSINEHNLKTTASTDTAGPTSAFAINLSADNASSQGVCILICAYQ